MAESRKRLALFDSKVDSSRAQKPTVSAGLRGLQRPGQSAFPNSFCGTGEPSRSISRAGDKGELTCGSTLRVGVRWQATSRLGRQALVRLVGDV